VLALAASMDGPAIAMIRTLQENPGEALRTPLNLPEEIDTLVVTTGDEVLHFHPATDGLATRPNHSVCDRIEPRCSSVK
jgi:hypothetical protein